MSEKFTPGDNEPPTCRACGEEYSLNDGMEVTDYCDPCAQELVPDLYVALEAICIQAESWHSVHGHTKDSVQCDGICELIPQMRAALAKARGPEKG